MKKFLALILAAAMIASTLIGCADTKKPSADGEHAPLTINFPTASSTGVL